MQPKKEPKNVDAIKQMIVNGHKNGKCDSSGRSVKNSDGEMIAKPTSMSPTYVCKIKWNQGMSWNDYKKQEKEDV